MDPVTGKFDPRRVLNDDETPEFYNYPGTTGGRKVKAACGAGAPCVAGVKENRKSYTANMIVDSGGFLYGPHFLFGIGRLTSEHLDVSESLRELNVDEICDNVIDEKNQRSGYWLVSATAEGVQTSSSFVDRMNLLEIEVKARDIPLPVVICLDNHASRYGEVAQSWFSTHQETILAFTEPPETSWFLQALDQMNKEFHHLCDREEGVHRHGGSKSQNQFV